MSLALILFVVLLTIQQTGAAALSWWVVIGIPAGIFVVWFVLSYLVVIFSDNQIEQNEKSWDWEDGQKGLQRRIEGMYGKIHEEED
jgi:hypothetical protein